MMCTCACFAQAIRSKRDTDIKPDHANELAKPRLVSIGAFYNQTIGRKLPFKEEYKVWRKSLENRYVQSC